MRRLLVLLVSFLFLFTALIPPARSTDGFTLIDTQYDWGASWQFCRNGTQNQYYDAAGADGINMYTVAAGVLTLYQNDDQGGDYYDVVTDQQYVYVAAGSAGLYAYQWDGFSLNYLANIDDGGIYYNLWCDPTYPSVIHCARGLTNITAYTFDGTSFTNVSWISAPGAYCINGNAAGNYIYVGRGAGVGLSAYTYAGGVYTLKDTKLNETGGIYNIWNDGTYIYTANDADGIYAYTFNGIAISYINRIDDEPAAVSRDIYGDGTYIYVSLLDSGVKAYSFSGTDFTAGNSKDDGSGYSGVFCSGGYIYCSCLGEGTRSYTYGPLAGTTLNVTTNYSSVTTTTSASIFGYVVNDVGNLVNLSFAYGTTWGLSSNITASPSKGTNGTIFTATLNGLSPSGILYLYKAKGYYGTTFANGTTYAFLTAPDPPLFFTAIPINSTAINLSWTNPYIAPGNNRTITIFATTSGYPTSPYYPYWVGNSTTTYKVINNLLPQTKYYFSAWTHIDQSSITQDSIDYATAFTSTIGGLYNITILYEGDLSPAQNIPALINSTVVMLHQSGAIINSTSVLPYYLFSMDANETPDLIYLYWNGSVWYRSVVTSPPSTNITFYVSNCSYNTTVSPYQQQYTFTFIDETVNQLFRSDNSTRFFIYLYNSSTPYLIHQNYLDASREIKVPLEAGKSYWCGIMNDDFFIKLLSYFQTSTSPSISIQILARLIIVNTTINLNDVIFVNITNDSSGLVINYSDISFTTSSVTFSIYNLSMNGTKTFFANYSYFVSNFQLLVAADTTQSYYIEATVDSTLFTTNTTFKYLFIGFTITAPFDEDWLNAILNATLGRSPLYDPSTNAEVTWPQLFVFIFFFFCLTTFGISFLDVGVIFASIAMIMFAGLFIVSIMTNVLIVAAVSIIFAFISLIRILRSG